VVWSASADTCHAGSVLGGWRHGGQRIGRACGPRKGAVDWRAEGGGAASEACAGCGQDHAVLYLCIYTYMLLCACMYIYTYIHTHTHTHHTTHTNKYTYVFVCIHIYRFIYLSSYQDEAIRISGKGSWEEVQQEIQHDSIAMGRLDSLMAAEGFDIEALKKSHEAQEASLKRMLAALHKMEVYVCVSVFVFMCVCLCVCVCVCVCLL